MMEKPKFCSKCGTRCKAGAKFCRNCGERLLGRARSGISDTIKSGGDFDQDFSKSPEAEPVIGSAETQVSETLPDLILEPAIQWKVFIGDIHSEAGQKAIQDMICATQGGSEEGFQQELATPSPKTFGGNLEEKVPSGPPFAGTGTYAMCPSCGTPVTWEQNFCKDCGASVRVRLSRSSRLRLCANCGDPLASGAKFCGSCGAAIEDSPDH